MNLWQLKTFCAVVEKKSFTKAVDVVRRTQPSISAQIAELEKFYGIQLLVRKGREVTLTEGGRILYRYARRILRLVDKSKETLGQLDSLTRGTLIVGASTIPGVYLLPKLLSDFSEEHPEVQVSMSITDSRDIINRVSEGELELGVVGKKAKDKRLEFRSLAEDRIVLIASPRSKLTKKPLVTLNDLKKESVIMREEGSGTRATVQKVMEEKGVRFRDLNIVMELGSTEAVKSGVIAGLGISFVSQWAIEREKKLKLIREVPVENIEIRRHFHIVTRKSWPVSRATQAFIDSCVSKAIISLQGER
jgi:DNA-binding transcriptional LysR family regulator